MKRSQFLSAWHIIFTLWLFLSSTESTFSKARVIRGAQQNERRMMMAGGYSVVENPNEHAQLQHVGDFVLQQLRHGAPSASYSFLSWLTEEPTGNTASSNLSFTIVEASQQVVAGMNYRFTMVLQKPSADDTDKTFVGAFTAVVYDHFGDLTVTSWGEELSEDQAMILLHGA